jgi:hypothetical protein
MLYLGRDQIIAKDTFDNNSVYSNSKTISNCLVEVQGTLLRGIKWHIYMLQDY